MVLRICFQNLKYLYSSAHIVMLISCYHFVLRSAFRLYIGESENKSQFGIHRCKWDDNIKIGFNIIGLEGVDCIQLA